MSGRDRVTCRLGAWEHEALPPGVRPGPRRRASWASGLDVTRRSSIQVQGGRDIQKDARDANESRVYRGGKEPRLIGD